MSSDEQIARRPSENDEIHSPIDDDAKGNQSTDNCRHEKDFPLRSYQIRREGDEHAEHKEVGHNMRRVAGGDHQPSDQAKRHTSCKRHLFRLEIPEDDDKVQYDGIKTKTQERAEKVIMWGAARIIETPG